MELFLEEQVCGTHVLRRDELSEAVDAKSDTNAQLQGLREVAKQLKALQVVPLVMALLFLHVSVL